MRSLLKKKPNKDLAHGRITCWYLDFISYDFDIEWIKGDNNPLADSLTREMLKLIEHASMLIEPAETFLQADGIGVFESTNEEGQKIMIP